MKRSILALALVVCSTLPCALRADWEFTHWEMSRKALWQAGKPHGIILATGPSDQYECSNAYAEVVYKVPYQLEDFKRPPACCWIAILSCSAKS